MKKEEIPKDAVIQEWDCRIWHRNTWIKILFRGLVSDSANKWYTTPGLDRLNKQRAEYEYNHRRMPKVYDQ